MRPQVPPALTAGSPSPGDQAFVQEQCPGFEQEQCLVLEQEQCIVFEKEQCLVLEHERCLVAAKQTMSCGCG